jgi:arginase/N-omega-hydroxy-L-arginine amidinohydrolase
MPASTPALTVFQGRAGDRNDLGIPGARSVIDALAARLNARVSVIGRPEPALNADWRTELAAAMPALRQMADHFEELQREGRATLTASSRCAVSLATLPVVARHHPDACVVWFDAHADLNTPQSTTSGYLGGLALSGPTGLWESGLGANLDLSNVVLVGSRDIDPFEEELIRTGKVRLVRPGSPGLVAELARAVAGRPIYVHLDCDVLDPGIVPTDFRAEGGLSLAELRAACTALATGALIGLEIAEFQVAWEPQGPPVSPSSLLDAVQPLVDRLAQRETIA